MDRFPMPRESAECEHEWEAVNDWFGDPSVPNGTQSFTYMRCAQCGEERAPQDGDL